MSVTFADIFAGIGGFHLAWHSLGAECVFAAEIDTPARKTYTANFTAIAPQLFSKGHYADDILTVQPHNIPDFDVLCAGFPCQPFSQAGHKRGFSENKDHRGNMFFILRDIIAAKRPKAIFLENVRHILQHDNGYTFQVIKETIEQELGYDFYYRVIKASDYGLPQHRARVYMIGFDKALGLPKNFQFPAIQPLQYTMSDVLGGNCPKDIGFTLRVGGRGSPIDDRRNWEFYKVDGEVKRIGISDGKKMMGFPDDFYFPVSNVQAMKQLGNSVAVNAVQATAVNILAHLHGAITTLPLPIHAMKRLMLNNAGEMLCMN